MPRLKAEGLKVFIDYIDFRLGAPIVTEMERAVIQSRYTVGVLSPSYLKSNFTDLESVLAEHIGLEQSQQRFIGLMRENCKPRLGIRARYYLDMTDEDEFEARWPGWSPSSVSRPTSSGSRADPWPTATASFAPTCSSSTGRATG